MSDQHSLPPAEGQLCGRVLLADDSSTLRRLIANLLRRAVQHVQTVDNGHDAVLMALDAQEQGSPYDLVLMDVMMPKLNGCDATRELRARGYTGKIIILTAADDEFDLASSLGAGADGFLPKPFAPRQLAQMIREVFAQPPLRPESP